MNERDLLSRACEAIQRYLALGNETFDAHGASFIRNRATPTRYDANHVGLIRTGDPDAIEALLERAEREFEAMPYRRFDIDALTPPEVEARLVLDGGYSCWDGGLHLILEDELKAPSISHDIREVVSKADWDAYSLLMDLWFVEDHRRHDREVDPIWAGGTHSLRPRQGS